MHTLPNIGFQTSLSLSRFSTFLPFFPSPFPCPITLPPSFLLLSSPSYYPLLSSCLSLLPHFPFTPFLLLLHFLLSLLFPCSSFFFSFLCSSHSLILSFPQTLPTLPPPSPSLPPPSSPGRPRQRPPPSPPHGIPEASKRATSDQMEDSAKRETMVHICRV